MNILLINHYAGSPEMGMEFRPYYLAREWVRMGHMVTIVAGDYSHLRGTNPSIETDFEESNVDGIRYCWIKTGSYEGNGAARAFSMFRFVGKLFTHAKLLVTRYKPDVVIASSTYPLDTYAVQKIARLSDAEYVHEVHDMWPSTLYEVGGMSQKHPFVQLMQIAENSAYKHCDKCVSLLPYAKDYMVEHGLQPDKFVHIPNGVVLSEWVNPQPLPEEHLNALEKNRDRFIVGYFGGHAVSNALDALLDAAKLEDDPEVLFVLVGKGVEKERLEQRAREESISNVLFLPAVSKASVPSLLQWFDCSYIGGMDSPLYRFGLCPNKMYDSMMAGLPTICAFNAPPTPIVVYECGVQVSPRSREIVEAVSQLKEMSEADFHAMGERGHEAAASHFTYVQLANAFVDKAFQTT
jgi:glycosyltransferase involved in cell wall biosynthesis